MAILAKKSSEGAHELYLFTEHTIGRSSTCRQVLSHRSVSSFHACVSWHGDAWVVRDLGSRNGTYVNDERVARRPRRLRRGDRLIFGDQDETWVLIDDSRPQALLILIEPDHDGSPGSPDLILGDLYVFPSDEDPRITIFQDADGRFFLEGADDDSREIAADEHVAIGDRTYRVHLPGPVDIVPTTGHSTAVESSVRTMRLTLQVAPDEESASAIIDAGAVQAELTPRVHLYLLVHLARLRIEDARTGGAQDGDEDGQTDADGTGWVSVPVLCDDLKISPEQLGLQVFRIRDDIKKLGLPDAGEIIDRRRRGWIRIGVSAAQLRLARMA